MDNVVNDYVIILIFQLKKIKIHEFFFMNCISLFVGGHTIYSKR